MLIVRRQQRSFLTHEWVFLWKCQRFWDRKCLDLRGTRTPNLLDLTGGKLTCWIVLKTIKDAFPFCIISWIAFNRRRPNSQWSIQTYSIAHPVLSIPCLLMPWRLKEPGHQQAWHWSSKMEYSVPSIRRVNIDLWNGLPEPMWTMKSFVTIKPQCVELSIKATNIQWGLQRPWQPTHLAIDATNTRMFSADWLRVHVRYLGYVMLVKLSMTRPIARLSPMAPWKTYIWHGDVITWKCFPHYWPFVRGIHQSLRHSPHKGQWCGHLMFPLMSAWINCWTNSPVAGDLWCREGHVTSL